MTQQWAGNRSCGSTIPEQAALKLFPHLAEGVMRRTLSAEQIKNRALAYMWNAAKGAARSLELDDGNLVEEMIDRLIDRIHGDALLDKFDPAKGDIEGFIFGVMKMIALEVRRERARCRIKAGLEGVNPQAPLADTLLVMADQDCIQRLRGWTLDLPPNQRDALARRYEVLADLDGGSRIANESMSRHYGLKRLRQLASESRRFPEADGVLEGG